MRKRPKRFYYLINCDHGFSDLMISDRRLHPGLVRELPDANERMHRVRTVHLIDYWQYKELRDMQRRNAYA